MNTPSQVPNTIGENLKKYLEAKGWSGAELARRVNIKPTTLIDILNGRTDIPRPDFLVNLIKGSDISVKFLFLGKGPTEGHDVAGTQSREALDATREIGMKIANLELEIKMLSIAWQSENQHAKNAAEELVILERDIKEANPGKSKKEIISYRESMIETMRQAKLTSEAKDRLIGKLKDEKFYWSKFFSTGSAVANQLMQVDQDSKTKTENSRSLQDVLSIVKKTIEILEKISAKKKLSSSEKIEMAEIIAEEVFSSFKLGKSEDDLESRIEKMMRLGKLLSD